MLVQEGREDCEERARLRELNSAKEEVALETGVDDERTSGWVHSGNVHCALDLLDGKLCSVIPMLVVLVLTDESDGTLGVIVIESRHVKIIDEVDELVLANRSVDLTCATLELLLKNCLQKHRVGVEVKVDDLLEIVISLGRQLVQQTLDDLGLTTTRLSDQKRRMSDGDKLLHDVLCGNSVDCWNCETRDWLRGIYQFRYVCCCQLVPLLKLAAS